MALKDELVSEVNRIVRTDTWAIDRGVAVPELAKLRAANHAVRIDATVLYADIAGSSLLVEREKDTLAAEVYKSFMYCCGRIARSEGGAITAYDGDRIMAVFAGADRDTLAVRAAMKMSFAAQKIVQSALDAQYGSAKYQLRYGVGIDTSILLVAKIGVRGDNDLVWVGRAANAAARLSDVRDWPYSVHITQEVFNGLHESVVNHSDTKQNMWLYAPEGTLQGRKVCKTLFSYTI